MSTPALIRVVEREARVYARLWRGLAFSTFVQPALYLGAMGIGLGGLVRAHSGSVDGLVYLDFIAPGLLVASAMQIAASESMWPVLGGAKWMRQFHGVVATPIRPGELYGGFVLWTAIHAMFGAVAFLFVAALLGAVPSFWGVFAVPAAALCAAAFCAPLTAFSTRSVRSRADCARWLSSRRCGTAWSWRAPRRRAISMLLRSSRTSQCSSDALRSARSSGYARLRGG